MSKTEAYVAGWGLAAFVFGIILDLNPMASNDAFIGKWLHRIGLLCWIGGFVACIAIAVYGIIVSP
jgi:hypothetical protein